MTQEETRPRPVVDAAESQKRRGEVIAALAAVFGGLPALLLTFDLITWSADQVAGYGVFLGILTGAAMVLFARADAKTALAVESLVTPGSDPMTNEGTPLVPVADDGYED